MITYILLVTKIGEEHPVVEELKRIEAITEVRTVYGEFDVIARVEHEDMRTLDTVVTKLRTIEGVLRSVTLISA
ncbi:MAG: Lrp/AsnC ligand binding domain-containing protein [Candidatus Bathyarchaeota archaeon]|nr:MAG: Lrp/AsnC ligand binding domain-containing protein [Candidatus Bathyarchaeota archaeon]